MAFVATEHIVVSGVGEYDISSVIILVEDITSVTGGTVTGHSERSVAIMTSAARFAVRHRLHRGMVAVVLRLEKVWMAIITTKHATMIIVAEHYLADRLGLDRNITSVAGRTISGDAKRLPTVVAGSAGFAPLHRFHADVVAIVLLLEELRVTHITLCAMQTVAEDNLADCLGLYCKFVHHSAYTPRASHTFHTYGVQNGRREGNQQNKY
jgi:hypothetical protein